MLYAYGEDAMTLYALTKEKKKFLKNLPDYEEGNNDLFFYRPSFGRKGGDTYSSFGEFDAIVASKTHIYLIESKWQRSNRAKDNTTLKLDDNQIERHKIFQCLWKQWQGDDYSKWDCFYEKRKGKYANTRKPLPKPDTLLAKNLFSILKKLKDKYAREDKPETKNILLLFYEDKIKKNQRINDVEDSFSLVPFKLSEDFFEEESGSKIFKLNLS